MIFVARAHALVEAGRAVGDEVLPDATGRTAFSIARTRPRAPSTASCLLVPSSLSKKIPSESHPGKDRVAGAMHLPVSLICS